MFISQAVIVNAMVPTPSMVGTILPEDRIFAFRPAYMFSQPKRYDIVVFLYPDDKTETFVKRVIGLPGETVLIKDGKVYIDGDAAPLRDDFTPETPTGDYGPYIVPEGEYFMLGDNRNYSKDSRYWENRFVVKGDILGKVVLKYSPEFEIMINK